MTCSWFSGDITSTRFIWSLKMTIWISSCLNVIELTIFQLLGQSLIFFNQTSSFRFSTSLWSAIDEEISLSNCNVYSYNPDLNSDPYGDEGCLWSFNFFFYNQKMKRILFFSCQAQSLMTDEDSMDVLDSTEGLEVLPSAF